MPHISRRAFLSASGKVLLFGALLSLGDNQSEQSELIAKYCLDAGRNAAAKDLIVGAWIHDASRPVVENALKAGIKSTRGYSVQDANLMRQFGGLQASHLGGLYVDTAKLLEDWQAVINFSDAYKLTQFGLDLTAICVGNELINTRDHTFSPDIVQALTRVLKVYRAYFEAAGIPIRLSYSIEGSRLSGGKIPDWLFPLIEVCDTICVNLYPMDGEDWVGTEAFEKNRRFLTEESERNRRFENFESQLSRILDQIRGCGKTVILSETGLSSAVDYQLNDNLYLPIHDLGAFEDRFLNLTAILLKCRRAFGGHFEGVYFYEFWDNYYHPKIFEGNSPIHNSFGLFDVADKPKLRIAEIMQQLSTGNPV